jgi:hypothetical protein
VVAGRKHAKARRVRASVVRQSWATTGSRQFILAVAAGLATLAKAALYLPDWGVGGTLNFSHMGSKTHRRPQ